MGQTYNTRTKSIEQGDYSVVEFAIDKLTNQPVVLKQILEDDIAEAELEITTRLQGQCDNLMKIITTYIDENGYRVLVFPKLNLINIEAFTSINAMKEFLFQMIEALSVMHKFGIVHGDIHFNNIYQNENGNLILADYGCSRFSKMFYKDIESLGLCFLRLLRLHLQVVEDLFADDLLTKIRSKSKGNVTLMQACDLANNMIYCKEITINKVQKHAFLKRKSTIDINSAKMIENLLPNYKATLQQKDQQLPVKY